MAETESDDKSSHSKNRLACVYGCNIINVGPLRRFERTVFLGVQHGLIREFMLVATAGKGHPTSLKTEPSPASAVGIHP